MTAPEPIPFRSETPRGFFPASAFHGRPVPPRDWHVPEVIPSSTVTLFGGDGGVGKSLLGLQLTVATAASRPWLGREVKAGRAIYFSAEDDEAELHRRLADIVTGEDIELGDLDRLIVRSVAGEDALLAVPNPLQANTLTPTPLLDDLERQVREDEPALVVIDTLADVFGGNENDRAAARQFISLLRGLAIRNQCAVVLLAHPSLAGMSSGSGLSGSTAWNASVRSRLYLERVVENGFEADPNRRRLSVKKANYARTGAEISLTWCEGRFVADGPEAGLNRVARAAKAERVFLKLLHAFAEEGRHVGPSGGRSYAPHQFAQDPRAEECSKKAFEMAMRSLFASGRLRVERVGPASRQVSTIVEVRS